MKKLTYLVVWPDGSMTSPLTPAEALKAQAEGDDVSKIVIANGFNEGEEVHFPTTSEDCGNQHGFICPACGDGQNITIAAHMNVNARLSPGGADEDGGDIEWFDTDTAWCGCGFNGTVGDLYVIDLMD